MRDDRVGKASWRNWYVPKWRPTVLDRLLRRIKLTDLGHSTSNNLLVRFCPHRTLLARLLNIFINAGLDPLTSAVRRWQAKPSSDIHHHRFQYLSITEGHQFYICWRIYRYSGRISWVAVDRFHPDLSGPICPRNAGSISSSKPIHPDSYIQCRLWHRQTNSSLVSTLHADHLPLTPTSPQSIASPAADLLGRLIRLGGGGWWRVSNLSSGRSGDVHGEVS